MGTWGPGIFDNDAASDWIGEFEESQDGSIAEWIRQTLITAIDIDYAEVDHGQQALVAASVVVAQLPKATSLTMISLPQDLRSITFHVGDDLRNLALSAVDRVMDRQSSELPDLWANDSVFEATVDQLKHGLAR